MEQSSRVLLSVLGAFLIFGGGIYIGYGMDLDKFNWLGFIPFTLGYISIVIAREPTKDKG